MIAAEITATTVALASSLIAGVSGFGGWLLNRRKVGSDERHQTADASSLTVAAALTLINPMKERLDTLEAEGREYRERIEELEKRDRAKTRRINHLEEGVEALTDQVVELGDVPRWPPASGLGGPQA